MHDEQSPRSRWQSIAETMALVAIALTIVWQGVLGRRFAPQPVAAVATQQPATQRPPHVEPPPPTDPVSLDGAAIQGQRTAKVALIVYSDFQCPFCGRFERDTLPAIQSRYVKSGEVLLAFHEFPLSMHSFAQKAAEAAECAGRQSKFWEMHDQLFAHQQQLDEPSLRQYGKAIGLNTTSFDACLAGQATDKVKQDAALGQSLHISGTPTFFIGQVQEDGRVKVAKRLSGAQPVAQFEAAIDGLIAARSESQGK